MIRAAIILLLLSSPAIAAPDDIKLYDPMRQVPTPDGTFKDQDAPPTKAEMFMMMWRQQAGDKPIPDALLKKYGLPPSINSPTSTR